MQKIKSGTTLQTFNPEAIPYQWKVTNLIRSDWDYSKGNLEILLSGSYGSAKSIEMAHLAITHCMNNEKAVAMLARKSMPDLKATIFKECIEHLDEGDNPNVKRPLIEGKDYWVNNSGAPSITFSNGSRIETISWADKKYKKGRSRKFSFLVIEELTENNIDDREAFMTLKARLRRLPHVKENVLIAATNPDAPSHWVHKYFIDDSSPTKFVFKSVTSDNPFLDPVYIEQLKKDLDPKAIQRYIYGEWVELTKDMVYYNYDHDRNFSKEKPPESDTLLIAHDFNIGSGKPMSLACSVKVGNVYHIMKCFHVEGARTLDIMEEMASSEILDRYKKIVVYGDASGKNRDTRSIKSDYDIIKGFLANYKKKNGEALIFEMKVPLANPPLRRRHNIVNAYFLNDNKDVRIIVYDKWIDEGFKLTSFKKNADMIEDDSLPQQHVTTAIGYMIDYDVYKTSGGSIARQL